MTKTATFNLSAADYVELQKRFQCLGYDRFIQATGFPDNDYAANKYRDFTRNPALSICYLDTCRVEGLITYCLKAMREKHE